MRVAPLVEAVVVLVSPCVGRLMKDQAVGVHRYLGLYGVPFLLAAVVGPPLTLVPGPRDLLLGGVQEGLEAQEEGLQFVEGTRAAWLSCGAFLAAVKPRSLKARACGSGNLSGLEA